MSDDPANFAYHPPSEPSGESAAPAAAPSGFEIYHRQTGQVVGRAGTMKRARSTVDRKDNAYGSYAHGIRPIGGGTE